MATWVVSIISIISSASAMLSSNVLISSKSSVRGRGLVCVGPTDLNTLSSEVSSGLLWIQALTTISTGTLPLETVSMSEIVSKPNLSSGILIP